jgi:peptide/nickel transport system substrate-binding protein
LALRKEFVVRGHLRKLALSLAASGVLVLAGTAGGASQKGDTLVWAIQTDPALLDPSLVSDGPSLQITDQIYNSLVGFKVGGTKVVPELATSWKPSKNGLAWTFNLRRGVRFQDGTRFNAKAVCTNFQRWFNFPSYLQSDALSYYWNTVFQGFAHPAPGNPGPDKALYKGCSTRGQYQAIIRLTRRSSSFLAAIALPNFGIASPAALKKYRANEGTVSSGGVFSPTGTFATRNPVSTGPYKLKSWSVGNRLELVRNPLYWGKKPRIARVIVRPVSDNAARLQALQTGEIEGFEDVAPEDIGTVRSNSKLRLLKRPVFSVGYVGINQGIAPMDKLAVRQAIAYGLDRASVVRAFYGGAGSVANQFDPPALVGSAKKGVPKYPYNPEKAKSLLRQAGLTLPVKVDFWYPTAVTRQYMPDPKKNFEAFAASLEKSGFNVVAHSSPWRPDYRSGVQAGKYQLFLFGWIADFADPANFLNVHFGSRTDQFGFTNESLFSLLRRADAETNAGKRSKLYQQANIRVMKFLPVVPYVWAASAVAELKTVRGYKTGPIGPVNEPFANLHFAGA